jgi:hydroxyacylglutathione hydrolase
MILEALTLGFVASNCYIVGSESTKRGMIIDPGAEAKVILKAVKDLGLTIPLIVATHTHFDHVGAVKSVKDATGAEFALHESEGEGGLGAFGRVLASVTGGSSGPLPKPERLLKDGDTIDIDDLHFIVLHTPGHSPGSISLVGHGVVFSGDTLFNFGIGRTDFPGCSHRQLINSIQDKLMALPDNTIVYPGHGPETTIGAERRMNPFL